MKFLLATARFALGLLALASVLAPTSALAQLPTTEERLKILTDPESIKAKIEKDKSRPPIEFFRSQIAPFDILPYVKANHWSTLSLELRANYDDYVGLLQTAPVALTGMPQEILYRRDARLLKTQRVRASLQLMLPRVPKELNIELLRPESVRADEVWQASLRVLEQNQMLVLVLTRESNDPYARWGRMQALLPNTVDRSDALAIEHQRYYRLVLPLEVSQPPLSSHPLTWTTISHVLWDGMAPEVLNPPQQQAMLDWLHWGGQLILIGGAQPSFAALRDSFLAPYLPADPSGENALLTEEDLTPLSLAYRPPVYREDRDDVQPVPNTLDELHGQVVGRYRAPEPIRPSKSRPVFLAGLTPRPGASLIPLGESSKHLLGIERRVGRGRILMLTVNPTDPAFAAWNGLDTMVRRVLLRRPEDPVVSRAHWTGTEVAQTNYGTLTGPELTWFRLLSRDLGASIPSPRFVEELAETEDDSSETQATDSKRGRRRNSRREDPTGAPAYASTAAVSEWIDSASVPLLSRDALEKASGISIPSASFVLKVILAYVLALVPLNWLLCRFVLGRRELAWVVVPLLSLAFAVGVERVAAYDMGYDAASDEIDLLETHGGYPRAHLSRFASLYTTGRGRFTISYPKDPTALALPMNRGRSLAGEDVTTSTWQSYPTPTLEDFQVEPRSLALFRAEQMVTLAGAIDLVADDDGPSRVVNETEMELRDAVLVDANTTRDRRARYLGTIAPGATVEVQAGKTAPALPERPSGLTPEPFLRELSTYFAARPEDQGELRLVAWVADPRPGQSVAPAVDRTRGFTLVVVHLRHGPPPGPDGPRYNMLARGEEDKKIEGTENFQPPPVEDPNPRPLGARGPRRRGPASPSPPVPIPPGLVPQPPLPR